ncbi:MAG: hypothetical protein OXI86_07195 [Candidatus Poribacteria bacterium]|nr:hypothetical protein [Candidatus Poribacteria bacterium]
MLALIDGFGDAKNLTLSDDVLDGDPVCRQSSVELLRLMSQGHTPTFLYRCPTVGILFGYIRRTIAKKSLALPLLNFNLIT